MVSGQKIMGIRWEQATPANPYSHHDCAPDWGTGTVEWWVSWSGCGFGFGSHHSSKRWGSEWGGSVPTPYMTAGGAVGSKGLSPEAAVWKTSGISAGPLSQRTVFVLGLLILRVVGKWP